MDTPPAFHFFFHDFETLFYILTDFFMRSDLGGWLITRFYGVKNSTQLLLFYSVFKMCHKPDSLEKHTVDQLVSHGIPSTAP